MMPKISITVAVVTYNRPQAVGELLGSLSAQTRKPDQVVVVDNGAGRETAEIVEKVSREAAFRGIDVRYKKNPANSLPTGRNIAVKMSTSDVVLFLDDDVLLESEYIEELLRVYEELPEAVGVQGYITNDARPGWRNFLGALFLWYHYEKGACRVLHSVSATYPMAPTGIIPCEWMSGANHSFRREIFQEFSYDEKLIKYADGEDLDLTYRVFCKYPGKLFLAPGAKLQHLTTLEGRSLGRELVYMREVYGAYLFSKLFAVNLFSVAGYVWSRFGRLVFVFFKAACFRRGAFAEAGYILAAYSLCLVNLVRISRGDIEFFNASIGRRIGRS